jgi:hypothetical protein
MKWARYSKTLRLAWLVFLTVADLATSACVVAAKPGRAAATPAYATFGGPAYGFIVSVPADWSRSAAGSAAQGAELDAVGPRGLGMTLLVAQQAAKPGQALVSLLPSGSRVLLQGRVVLPWATGIDATLLRTLRPAAGGVEQRTELHAVLSTGSRLFHVAVSVTQDRWATEQGAAQVLYHTLLNTLAPFLYPAPATPEGTMLAYWSAVGRHDAKAAYRLESMSLRRKMTTSGASEETLAPADRRIVSLGVEKWQAITPAQALAGPDREYMVILRLHVNGVTSWDDGLNVRYVKVVPGTETPWAVGAIASVPIPL